MPPTPLLCNFGVAMRDPKGAHHEHQRPQSETRCDILHETGAAICYGNWALRLVISHRKQEVRFVTGIGLYTGGTICYRHSVLRLVISYTRQACDMT